MPFDEDNPFYDDDGHEAVLDLNWDDWDDDYYDDDDQDDDIFFDEDYDDGEPRWANEGL